jgi:hypothetical protein
MLIDVARLMVGVLLMAFHRPVADFFADLDHGFAAAVRARGLYLPTPPKQSVMHTLYFCLGICVSLFAMTRLYSSLPQ